MDQPAEVWVRAARRYVDHQLGKPARLETLLRRIHQLDLQAGNDFIQQWKLYGTVKPIATAIQDWVVRRMLARVGPGETLRMEVLRDTIQELL